MNQQIKVLYELTPGAWAREAERCTRISHLYERVDCDLRSARKYQRLARECAQRAERD